MPDDREILEQLNRDYVAKVQHSDVRRFDEILAEEFYRANPDDLTHGIMVNPS